VRSSPGARPRGSSANVRRLGRREGRPRRVSRAVRADARGARRPGREVGDASVASTQLQAGIFAGDYSGNTTGSINPADDNGSDKTYALDRRPKRPWFRRSLDLAAGLQPDLRAVGRVRRLVTPCPNDIKDKRDHHDD
jgi:hypothetical protein